ncbi:MAG: hypothetical protein A4E45_01446 [Methanosaeta sp. PtaB.Bin039]|nr:MAG: hypothetical protein A4E45_01446 [Methanosaeta sp. PtaB.Bin039]OPY46050.1 MAG: hypothetical protein A4E47_00752 [Methanosaeta sp. PtaU1.Bin028]HOT06611.1 hypothetical protein [Methanotrichaceae archaeon]HQF16507.1 hypothetical protein [Methanotrichaceae archaeon]HQI91122.1 hypothetical protein [Methanotrichaceae archaeon]
MESYGFLSDLNRLKAACRKFERKIAVLNGITAAAACYSLFLLLGVSSYFRFYWKDSPLAYLPALLALAVGAVAAHFVGKRSKTSVFQLLPDPLSQMARTGWDNRQTGSVIMESLAGELKRELAGLEESGIFDRRRLYRRVGAAVGLGLVAALIAQSQISADLTPEDFSALGGIGESALGLFQNGSSSEDAKNITPSIYGKPSLAVLAESKLELEIYPGSGVGSRALPAEAAEHLFSDAPPGQGVAVASELYIESLPAQHRDIIKRYFERLAEAE